MFIIRQFFLASALFAMAQGQPPSDSVTVGQEICAYGYVMDEYCITFGKLLDAQQFETLENPEEHSVHCLVDVPLCYDTPFHILTDPADYEGDTTYGPGWAASDNTLLLDDARKLGDTSCTTCMEGGSIQKGLRAQVMGTVVTVDPPVLDITSVKYLMDGEMGCTEMEMMSDNGSDASTPTPTTAEAETTANGASETEPEPSAAVQLPSVVAAVVSGVVAAMI